MKKLLSVMLAAIMVMSLFGVVSVSAADTVGTKYYFQDFEDCTVGDKASNVGVGSASGLSLYLESNAVCADGDGKAVNITVSKNSAYHETRIGGATAWTIDTNETLIVSGKIKYVSLASQQSSTGTIRVVGNSTIEQKVAYVTPDTGIWQDFSISYLNDTGARITMNNSSYYLTLRVWAPKNSVYLLDDLEIKVVKQGNSSQAPVISNAKAHIDGTNVVYSYDFASSGTDKSIIKLKDGNKVLGAYSYGDAISVPDANKSSEELALEIVPIDSNANIAMHNVNVSLNSPAYLVADFEDGNTNTINVTNCTTSITDKGQGAGGSDYALDVSVKKYAADPRFNVALRKGYSYDVSMWIKVSQDLLKNQAWLIFIQTPADPSVTGTKYYEKQLTLDEKLLTSNGWVYAHAVIDNFSGLMNSTEVIKRGTMSVRLGNGIIADTTGTSSIDFMLDDVTIMPREKHITEGMDLHTFDTTKPVYSSAYNQDGFRVANATATITAPETTVTIADETLGNYLKITGNGNYNQIYKRNSGIKNGVLYDLYFWAKADDETSLGKVPKVYLSRSYKANDEDGRKSEMLDATIISATDSSGTYTDSLGVTNDWRIYKARFKNSALCSDELLSDYLIYRLSDSSSDTNLNFSMGNFKIVPVTDNINALDGYTNSVATAFKTGDGTYNVDFSSSVPYGDISNVITRIMLPYKDRHVIRYVADGWENDETVQLSADEIKGAKMLVTAKDRTDSFGQTATINIQIPDEAQITVVAEFDQVVWGKDMDKLTATVYYNNLSGESTLNALCATYDENNKLITSDVKPLSLSNGEGQVKLSMNATSESKKARLFFWDENFAPIKNDTAPIERNMDANFIYVSTKGSNEADGGFTSPVATIEKALEKQAESASSKDTYIILMQGNHMQSKELDITNAHTANGKLIIASYDKNDKGVISGGYKVGEFTDANGDGIYEATVDIAEFGLTEAPRQLYVNGTKATRARSGILTDFKNTTTYCYASANLPARETIGHLETTDLDYLNYERPQDLEFIFYGSWAMARCQAASVEAATNSDGQSVAKFNMDETGWAYLTARRYTSGNVSVGGYPPRYVENALELLDEEGEWYLNTDNDTLYYKPRVSLGENIAKAEVILPVIDNYEECLVNIEGTTGANVKNLTFDNVTFAHTTWTRPSTELGHADIQNNTVLGHKDLQLNSTPTSSSIGYGNNPEGAIDVKYANNVNFENCDFTKLGITGLRLTEGVKNSTISGNEFYDISGSAIAIGLTGVYGVAANTFRNPEEAKKIDSIDFSNNYVHHVATEYNGAAALSIGFPSNSTISHNEIAFIPYTGMHIGWGWEDGYKLPGTNTYETSTNLTLDITNNYIHDLFQGKIYDGGAIYTLGLSGGTAADKNKISGNFIENIGPGAATIYNDQGSTCYEVYNNVSDTSDSWTDTCVTTGDTRGASNSCNVNVKKANKNLSWHDNYATVVKYFISSYAANDATSSFEDLNLVKDLKNNATTKAIIDNAGIEPEYRNNFRAGLQNMMVIDEITLSVGESVNNTPFYITGKNTEYKNGALKCYVSNSNPSVATATQERITANAPGEAIIAYTVLENGICRTVTTKVTVE